MPRTRAPRLSAAEYEERRINRQFGAAVKGARESRGLSYRAAAEALDIALSHLQAIEKGERSTGLPAAWTRNCTLWGLTSISHAIRLRVSGGVA